MEDNRMVSFSLGGMAFEYDDNKNQINIKKHGISFKSAARIFFDYDRIEFYDEDHSDDEDRYNTIGDTSAGRISQKAEGALIGNVDQFIGKVNEILFVVYTERVRIEESGTKTDVTRLISALNGYRIWKGGFIMVKTSEMSMELKQELAFTKEELAELEAAKKMPITFDADCPETTPERAVKFRRVNPPRNRMDAHGA